MIEEQFVVGGTDLLIHKYLGPKNTEESEATPTTPSYAEISVTNIQDILFLENRDRKYDQDVYVVRGVYNVQDIDYDLSQFGLFLSNDILFLSVHIRNIVRILGRKPISGDVIELPHLKDEYALNDFSLALKRFYVIEEVSRGSEGFSPTWYPHLYRLKLKQIYDSQEYKDILNLPADQNNDNDTTLRDLMSTYEKEMQINEAILNQARSDSEKSGFETSHLYTITELEDGGALYLLGEDELPEDFNESYLSPLRFGYIGYLLNYGDGNAPNGEPFGAGIQFPGDPVEGDYFLRTDYMPNRLFRYDGSKWLKLRDDLRMTLDNSNDRQTLKGSFINNTNTSEIGGETVEERQSLSKALRPRSDN